MGEQHLKVRWMLVIALMGLSSAARSQERVHSDLPLFYWHKDELYPKGFQEADGGDISFGCSSRIALGDWRFAADPGAALSDQWLRLTNYGVFHCAYIERWSYDREKLDRSGFKYSWFVKLDDVTQAGSALELWALQSGSRPGSDYLLLARKPADELIKAFQVLPVDCPSQNLRKGEDLDVWRTDYCAINSVQELRSFAQKMASRPPVGTLAWVARAPEGAED